MDSGSRPILLRPFQAPDLPALVQTFSRAVREIACSDYHLDEITAWAPVQPDLSRWRNRLRHLDCLVAICHRRIGGFVATRPDGYFDFLFVHPDFQRQGLARKLQENAEAALLQRGILDFSTHASLTAKGFFERVGFEVEHENTVNLGGTRLQNFFMETLRDRPTKLPSLA